MAQFLAIIKLITQFLIALPLIERGVKSIIAAINEAIRESEQKKLEKDLQDAAAKAIKDKDTSDLENLMGKPK